MYNEVYSYLCSACAKYLILLSYHLNIAFQSCFSSGTLRVYMERALLVHLHNNLRQVRLKKQWLALSHPVNLFRLMRLEWVSPGHYFNHNASLVFVPSHQTRVFLVHRQPSQQSFPKWIAGVMHHSLQLKPQWGRQRASFSILKVLGATSVLLNKFKFKILENCC